MHDHADQPTEHDVAPEHTGETTQATPHTNQDAPADAEATDTASAEPQAAEVAADAPPQQAWWYLIDRVQH